MIMYVIFFMSLIFFQSTIYEQIQKKPSVKDLISTRGNRKGLWLNAILFTIGQLTGITVVQLYLEFIFIKSGSHIPAQYSAMIIGMVQFVSAGCAPPIINWLGYRKPLLMSSIIISIAQVRGPLYI